MIWLAKNMVFLRKLRGELQSETAANLGLKRTTFNNYEQGVSTPPLQIVFAIADYFGVDVENLVMVDLSANANLIEKKEISKNQQNANLSANPSANPNTKKGTFKDNLSTGETAFNQAVNDPGSTYMSTQAQILDLYRKIEELTRRITEIEHKLNAPPGPLSKN